MLVHQRVTTQKPTQNCDTNPKLVYNALLSPPRCQEMLLLDVIIKAIVHLCPPDKNDGTATFILDHVLLIATSILEYHQIMIMIMSITHLVFGIAMGFSENHDVCPLHPLVNNDLVPYYNQLILGGYPIFRHTHLYYSVSYISQSIPTYPNPK